MLRFIKRLLKDESGATAIEYGLLVAFLGVGLSVAMTSMKTQLNAVFTALTTTMSTASQ